MHERIQRDRKLNPEEAARLREARAEFAQQPSKTQLLESGEYVGPMSIEEYLSWRKGPGGSIGYYPGSGSIIEEYLSWRKGPGSAPLARQLQAAIAACGEPLPAIAQASGVSASVLQHFVSGQRDITLETAGKVAAHLGLALMSTAGK